MIIARDNRANQARALLEHFIMGAASVCFSLGQQVFLLLEPSSVQFQLAGVGVLMSFPRQLEMR